MHQPDYSRAARVVDDMIAGHVLAVWISARYSAQQKHGERNQTCLAHLARDAVFAFEHGSDDLPFRFKLWFGKAFDLARAVADFAASTLARKNESWKKQLEALLSPPTGCDLARELQAKIGRARDQLLTFCDYPGEVDVTNNTSERKLRPCVIQRKVTNGYRAMWAAEAEADVRTTIDTARLKGANPFNVIVSILARAQSKPRFRRSKKIGVGNCCAIDNKTYKHICIMQLVRLCREYFCKSLIDLKMPPSRTSRWNWVEMFLLPRYHFNEWTLPPRMRAASARSHRKENPNES